MFNWLQEIVWDAEAIPTSAASFRVGLYIFKYTHMCVYISICICLNIAKREKTKTINIFLFFSLNDRSHQWEEQRDRGQYVAESPTQWWLRDMFWPLCNLQLQGEEFTADYFDNILKWILKSNLTHSILIIYLGLILTFFSKIH